MKILILSASHPYKTAGIVALDIYNGLKNIKGNNVKLVVKLWDRYKDKNIIPFEDSIDALIRKTNRFYRRFKLLMTKLKLLNAISPNFDLNYEIQDFDQTITYCPTNKILSKAGIKPDVIIVLFMQGFLSFKNLYELNKETTAPVFLFMMDMAPLTGGCHYSWDCKGFTETCGNCPALFSDSMQDQSRKNWLFKNEYVNKTNVIPMAASEWQHRQLMLSSLYHNKSKVKILLPINEDQFKPGNKIGSQKHLRLPNNKKIIFIGALSANNKRKGFSQLIDTLQILSEKLGEESSMEIHLAIAGEINKDLKENIPFDCTLLGYLTHNELVTAFQAADLFVCPSIEDSGPMMINQSIICGTPVIAFETGVALDLIENCQTGFIAKPNDVNTLAEVLFEALRLSPQEYNKISIKCRTKGLEFTSQKAFVKTFYEIINDQGL
jgi:glycosyltransferase involved in cell wall biosynthesis